jgi:hypothetical protein
MLFRILLAILKTAACVALYGFVTSVLEAPNSPFGWITGVGRSAAAVTGLPYRDSLFLISGGIAFSLFQILSAVCGVVSARLQQPR